MGKQSEPNLKSAPFSVPTFLLDRWLMPEIVSELCFEAVPHFRSKV
jgi:hypothetical protein